MKKEYFLNCVTKHKMTIVKDDGVFRHLVFSRPESGVYRFHITTFPEYLVITGDCGSYIFSRLHDMFEFFRRDELSINAEYWEEKLEAQSYRNSIKVFSPEKIKAAMEKDFSEWLDGLDESEKEDAKEEFEEKVISYCVEECFLTLGHLKLDCGYQCKTYYYDPYVYSDGFLFCLYAIVWGIMQYDTMKGLVKS